MKLMKGTDFEKYKKDFVALPFTEGDIFTILRPTQPYTGPTEIPEKVLAL
jgi:hypothetical protein